MLDTNTLAHVKKLLKEYYTKNDIAPSAAEKREFAFGDFEKKIAFRHVGFKSASDFKKYIIDTVPASIHASAAEYETPDAKTMDTKGWIGSELVFDLDASDLNLPCQKRHNRSWTCDECLIGVKHETTRLIEDFLVPDFGFAEKDIRINFSGNRGYHMHIKNDAVFKLDSDARRNISNYVSGIGINFDLFFREKLIDRGDGKLIKNLIGPKPNDIGWGGKSATAVVHALNGGEQALLNLELDETTVKKLSRDRAALVLGLTLGNWGAGMKNTEEKAKIWKEVVEKTAIKLSKSIDKNVTNETQHMIRLPNSIHSDTALIARRIASIKDLDKFNPMRDAIAFKDGTLKIHVDKSERIFMNDAEYGPYENNDIEVPTYVGLYLILKRVATLR